MPSLYELDRIVETVIEHGFYVDEGTGEVFTDFGDLDDLLEDLDDKLEACGKWIKGRKALINSMRVEEQAMRRRREVEERKLERMKDYVMRTVLKKPGQRFECGSCSMGVRKSSRVVIDDEAMLPEQFVTVTERRSPSKSAIRDAIRLGEEVPGAHIDDAVSLTVR